jgi:tRNA A37 methylthiotransferase MiaB
VAQQEGERIFEKAPYVSLVAGSASYRNLPDMLRRLEAVEQRITGLDDRLRRRLLMTIQPIDPKLKKTRKFRAKQLQVEISEQA